MEQYKEAIGETDDDLYTHVARVCHEANRAYCAALGDYSQQVWDAAPSWQRDSAVNGVKFIVANPEAGPAASHESWLAEKRNDGWTYGTVKDPVAKTHPCFLPYSELPVEQRAKDYIFGAIVRAMLGKLAGVPATETHQQPAQQQQGNAGGGGDGGDPQRSLTEGEKRVRVSFNPSGNARVDSIKSRAADLIDDMLAIAANREHPGAREAALAATHYETAAMYAVKAATAS